MKLIRHLVPASEFDALPLDRPYLPAAFAQDGFIHCTLEPEILLHIASSLYREVPGEFLVLVIDAERVLSEVRFEGPLPAPAPDHPLAGHVFPHIYGPLNRDAIVEVRHASRAPDGTFLAL